MNEISQILPLLIPIIIIELGLMIWALIDLIKQPATRGPKWMWALIIILPGFYVTHSVKERFWTAKTAISMQNEAI